MKGVLIETANDEELKMVEAFIKENKMKGFIVEDSKANETDFLSDVARLLIPII
jgi:hypothetical protein